MPGSRAVALPTDPVFNPKNPQPDARSGQKEGRTFQVWMKSRQLDPGPSQPEPRAGWTDSAVLQLFPEKRQLESAG